MRASVPTETNVGDGVPALLHTLDGVDEV